MKNKTVKKVMAMNAVILLSAAVLGGCGQDEGVRDTGSTSQGAADAGIGSVAGTESGTEADDMAGGQAVSGVSELEVRFGDDGEPFMMRLTENETAKAIARYVGTSDWRLPIYERDDDADYDVMQYYDVSSRYDIPSDPETVTSEKAGEVYYSDPNRIVLFYHDAEITGEYTRIGTFDPTEEFVTAVEENPVLEGWGNKIVQIARS
ncbi:hypothetical protein MCG98_11170 [Ruminococcus sp. OA3]|uniref:cyclophilin-like fold protein n=1 Tax=Ruminococcus sp. OA3 TaxID=2914164 RepID=UPI001F0543A2|nr:cyclophilin-like fold protein [Ruminococcus sp. OA3]MCH1983126.1 hypothetical protein [Ruminococcus sp. OA3]